MAAVVPSNSAIDRIVRAYLNGDPAAARRVLQLNADNDRLQLQDSSNTSTDRGPVRGAPNGALRRR